jgi:hypothetical protein
MECAKVNTIVPPVYLAHIYEPLQRLAKKAPMFPKYIPASAAIKAPNNQPKPPMP